MATSAQMVIIDKLYQSAQALYELYPDCPVRQEHCTQLAALRERAYTDGLLTGAQYQTIDGGGNGTLS